VKKNELLVLLGCKLIKEKKYKKFSAGDIAAIVGLKRQQLLDTRFVRLSNPIVLESIDIP
jgi:translation elongation factor EF-G